MTRGARELARALEEPQPLEALRRRVIRRLTADGASRERVLGDLEELRVSVAGRSRDKEEIVLALMDQVVGFCNPRWSLKRIGVSEIEDVVRETAETSVDEQT